MMQEGEALKKQESSNVQEQKPDTREPLPLKDSLKDNKAIPDKDSFSAVKPEKQLTERERKEQQRRKKVEEIPEVVNEQMDELLSALGNATLKESGAMGAIRRLWKTHGIYEGDGLYYLPELFDLAERRQLIIASYLEVSAQAVKEQTKLLLDTNAKIAQDLQVVSESAQKTLKAMEESRVHAEKTLERLDNVVSDFDSNIEKGITRIRMSDIVVWAIVASVTGLFTWVLMNK
jgi:hypothetical protein